MTEKGASEQAKVWQEPDRTDGTTGRRIRHELAVCIANT